MLRGLDVRTVAGGGAAERLATELTELAKDADAIISFGMAGALSPDLRLGDWVIGDRVSGALDHACDDGWVWGIKGQMPGARIGAVHADGQLIADPAKKADLNRTSACLIADMESHVAAAVARRYNLPFVVLRCVSDEAAAALPPAIAVAMKPGGGLALGSVLGSLLSNPGQVPSLIRTVAGFNRAYAELRAGAQQVGRRLAYDWA